ncbi:hypothetical protein [Spiroplasma endosymbiont of Megaselia nigra]|uniref:hypothetical protein n=1 Tax=Spiroplasma endosymbiont of Megaselia nigra TaxID=2478537 RepID=UPI000F8609DA|nr:hypothetical protein [Spiroplasma endosymbiont of Megaselia nigra]RUO85865.1 hypothetical protein D9R21_06330 [Spiroplasma endosymbiont of Megaselia nigra]
MSDIVKNTVNSITFQFPLKGDDFKELSLKALTIKKWIDENGQELAEFIYRHHNHYALNGYQDIHLKDIPSLISKVDIVFKEPSEIIKPFKDNLNLIRTYIINLEKLIENHKIGIKNNINQVRIQKQNEFFKEQELKKQELIEKANNLTVDMGLDIEQIQDEQVRVMEEAEKIDKSLEPKELKKVGINLIKEKLLVKDIEIVGINDDAIQKADRLELISLIKGYLLVDEKLVKNEIKEQWDSNKDINTIGVKFIDFKINKGVK